MMALEVRRKTALASLAEAEFRVYSQFGDDGIIQYLVARLALPPERQSFIEFGVEDYREANTRFLLINDNWRGLVLDADGDNVRRILSDGVTWRHDLTAVSAHITAENIDDLLTKHGFAGDIGLLHIDIDGNDYWVWKAITVARPAIAIVEYNAVFGAEHAVTIPYDPGFARTSAHHSNLYYGASLSALARLADEKGYTFVGCNSAGNNAYFVQRAIAPATGLKALSARDGFVPSRFRESRDASGKLTYVAGDARLAEIADCVVQEVATGRHASIRTLFQLP